MRFVDFEASYDGPVIPGTSSNVSIDDLIICEDCAKACANQIGYENGADLRGELSEQRKQIEELEKQIRAKDKTIVNLNSTVEAVIDFPPKKTSGNASIIGPASRKDELAQVKKSRHRSQRQKAA